MTMQRTCRDCGEDWPAALHVASGLCRNHAALLGVSREPYRAIIAHCPTCGRTDVPAQWHHVAGVRQGTWHGKARGGKSALDSVGLLLCLNCHGIITDRQSTGWDPSWKTESHPVRCTFQGLFDLFWLWWQRSGVDWWRNQGAELAHVVLLAALALTEAWRLRGWEVAV